MKKLFLIIAVTGFVTMTGAQNVAPAIPRDEKIEQQVETLLKKMTLEEKIGQMTELSIDLIGKRNPIMGVKDVKGLKKVLKDYRLDKEFKVDKEMPSRETMMQIFMRIQSIDAAKGFQVDEAMLDTIIGKYKVGSILNAPGVALSPEKWQEIIGLIQEKSMGYIGIPCIYGLDQNHGTTYTLGGTMFPQNLNVAASFNTGLAYEAARITAYETKAGSCPWTYSPTLDLSRDPRWSRMWENYGEDCLVNAQMGAAAVRGFQGEDPNHIGPDNIAVSVKHYMGYGVPRTGKDRTPAYISAQDLREKHFAPYKAAIEAGALTIMVNSGSINGMPVHANHDLLTVWLKEGLNWDGMIVTDWADINNLFQREKIAKDKKEAIRIAINAGIDMTMDPYSWDFCKLLKELVNEGQVSMERIDDATRRVLRLKYRLGLFERPVYDVKDYPEFGSKEHGEIALRAAEETMILLKNKDNILPLAKGKKILVTGPNANSMRCLNGGWSYTWQGHRANEFTADFNTILEAMQQKFGAGNIVYEAGVTYNEAGAYWEENVPEIDKAVEAAKNVDMIVACIGENSYCETPGNLNDLTLSANQQDLVKALAKTGKPIVLILNEGRPRLIKDIEPLASAVVDIILPGNYGGDALANLLAGNANFSGRLPITYPKDNGALTNYDYKVSEQVGTMAGAYDYNAVVDVQWAFGYGLSYTTFEYSDFKVNKPSFTADDELVFTVDVKNTGNRAGKETVMLFSSDLVASLVPDSRRLRAFTKIELQPGETRTVTLRMKGSDLAFVGYDAKWVLEEGDFRMQAGNQVMNLTCTESKKWDTPNR